MRKALSILFGVDHVNHVRRNSIGAIMLSISSTPRRVNANIGDKTFRDMDLRRKTQTSEFCRERQVKKRRAELHDLNAEIGRLQELLAKLGPEQKRIAVAERVRSVLSSLNEQLRPITVERLQDSVTSHFVKIADKRYRKGKIVFQENGSPVLRSPDAPDALIEMMSGFERRSFGIAFSLALAEITQKRVPLVIDTPLGNADQGYRRRLLKALMNVDLDQVIILTHDAEVTGPVFEEIEAQVRQYFLVEFDEKKKESIVYPERYFDGIGR